jgi:hypothetical protein
MSTACVVHVLQRCTGRTCIRLFLILQEVRPIGKTRNQLVCNKGYRFSVTLLIPTVCPSTIPLIYYHINSFQQAYSVERPLPGGEKRIGGRASHHEEL